MMQRKLNWKPDMPDFRDFKYAAHPEMQAKVKLPDLVDLRKEQSPIVDQGQIGSCTGNAIAGALEFLELQEMAQKKPGPEEFDPNLFSAMSRLFIYYNERLIEHTQDQDAGAQIRDGIKSIRRYGICRESVWPYLEENLFKMPLGIAYQEAENHKVLTGYRVSNYGGVLDMMTCLANGYPFVFGIAVYNSFMSQDVAQTGNVPMPRIGDQPAVGGHAILCVGYDNKIDRFIVKNSWGSSWGDQGYCYIPYEYLANTDLCSDVWTLRRQ